MENSFIQYLHDKLQKIYLLFGRLQFFYFQTLVFYYALRLLHVGSRIQRRPFFKQKQVCQSASAQRKLTHFLCYSNTSKHAYDMGKISIKLVNKKNSSLWQTAIECMDIMQIVTSKTESSKSKMTALFCQRRLSRGLFYFPELVMLGTVTQIQTDSQKNRILTISIFYEC